MAPKAVLDASALVALVHSENGHDTVRRIIEAGFAVTTPTGLAEALNTLGARATGGRGRISETTWRSLDSRSSPSLRRTLL